MSKGHKVWGVVLLGAAVLGIATGQVWLVVGCVVVYLVGVGISKTL